MMNEATEGHNCHAAVHTQANPLLGEADLDTSICQDLYNRHDRLETSTENVG